LNGTEVIDPDDFSDHHRDRDRDRDRDEHSRDHDGDRRDLDSALVIERSVRLLPTDNIAVEVLGRVGGSISVSITAVDNTPPTITATASPSPNAAGWNNTNVTVTFICSDSTAPIVSCPAPQTIITEGAKQIISGTATDAAGNTATATVILNIDRTPPTITAVVSPLPNAAGWNNSNVTVNFTCSDTLSGVASCPSPVGVTAETAGEAISGTATDVAGNTASASATVKLDKTPPTISITSPANGATFTSSSAAVTGSVFDALSGVAAVACDGAPATVQSGAFSCSVTLTPGSNTITAQASDVAGNTSAATDSVTFSNTSPPTITSFSPTSGPIGTQITVTGSNFTANNTATPNVTLSQQGGGSIAAPVVSFTDTSLTFVIPAGAASGTVSVTTANASTTSAASLNVVPSSAFSMTAGPSSANVQQGTSTSYSITLSSSNGFSQLAQLNVTGFPSGVTGSFSPTQITTGQTSIFTVRVPAGQTTGNATLIISAAATIDGIPTTQSASVGLSIQATSTSLIGRIVESDSNETPVPGVTATFLGVDDAGNKTGCSGQTRADAAGNFAFTNLGTSCLGRQLVAYDGNTATDGEKYASVNLGYTMVGGQVTGPELVHLPVITSAETIMVKQNASVDQVFSYSTIPGITATVYAGTTLTLPDGTQPDPFPMAAVLVPVDRLPDAPSPTTGTLRASIVAFQPADTTSNQPVSVTFPNIMNNPPGVNMELDTLDPVVGELVKYGTGTVSADASVIVPDADPAHPGHRFGISHFDWHGPMAPAPNNNNPGPDPNCPQCGDPVDTSSGIFVESTDDIAFGNIRGQVGIKRIYRTLAGNAGPFGVGTSHNYGYLLDTSNLIRQTGTFVNLVMPDGNQFQFVQQGTNTFVNSTIPRLLGAVITSPSTGIYNLRWKNGTVFQFQTIGGALLAFLTSITDANGNTTTLVRGNSSQPVQITQIVDPVGRALNISYDNFNRILSLTDPIGRTVRYTYNSQGTLATVIDPAGGTTSYAYDAQNRMTSATDPRGITFLQNVYDATGRVIQQTVADGGVTTFAYTLLNPTVPTSPILLTAVTDPLGRTTAYHFNPQGFLLDMTDVLGRRTVYTRDPGTNLLLTVTDPLNRLSSFTYDAAANVTSITRLAGTPDAVVTSFTYEPRFNKRATIIDPLGHTTSYTYDTAGNLINIEDALHHQTKFTYDSSGEMLTLEDPSGNVTTFAYGNRDLVRITDPLGRSRSIVSDAVSRILSFTNSLGQRTQFQYSPLNKIAQVIDPLGNTTSFSYDPNKNLLSITDAFNHTVNYTYDKMNGLVTRADALGHSDSRLYDLNGNVTQTTDRNGHVTTFRYDELNRVLFKGFATQPGSKFDSTISYAYDAGGRLIQSIDSLTGTITDSYDGLNRLTSEVTPEGKLSYSYDARGRRTSLDVSGQEPITYSYDDLNRLTQIVQNGSSVAFDYDPSGRRSSMTLPNNITVSYGYDSASELTSLSYARGGLPIGDLSYSYDAAGRRSSVSGSLAATSLPSPAAGSYNAANELIQWAGSSFTYDANGNLLSDGARNYSWDSRNQLASLNSGANFQYDAFGRRVAKTTGGTTTRYLYDGVTPVQELTGGSSTVGLLTGLGIDEYFARADSTSASYFLADALGSTVALTDASGAITTSYIYEPFGSTSASSTSTNPYQYQGRENDANGLYFLRARYYDTRTQRFISEDPSDFAGGGNLYEFVAGNPLSYIDPFGRGPGDKWYGYNNRDFQDWFHRQWKQPGDPDATKEEIEEAYKEWVDQGKPKRDKSKRKPGCDDGEPEPEPQPEPEPDPESNTNKFTQWVDDNKGILIFVGAVIVIGGVIILTDGAGAGALALGAL
jgi:RHS repeat-associated protein